MLTIESKRSLLLVVDFQSRLMPVIREAANPLSITPLRALVSTAAGAKTAVARTSIAIAPEPVGCARFERVLQRLTSGRLTAGDLIGPSPSFFRTWPPSPVTANEASSR